MEVCRACLKSEFPKKMIPFDESFVNNYNLLTNLNVSLFDGMSQYICVSCNKKVQSFITFRESCISSEYTLQEHLVKQIKEENVARAKKLIIHVPIIQRSTRKYKKNNYNTCDAFVNTENDWDNLNEEEIYIKNEIKDEEVLKSFEENIINVNNKFDDKNQKELIDERPKRRARSEKKKISEKSSFSFGDEILKRRARSATKKISEKSSLSCEDKPRKRVKTNKKKISDTCVLSCGLCKTTFLTSQSDEYTKHIESHSSDLNCQLCTETFESWPELIGHRIDHLDKNEHKCHLCKKMFMTPSGLEFHFKKCHLQMEKVDLRCRQCSKRYDTLRKLQNHIMYMHNKKHFTCDHCSKKFSTKSPLVSHMRSHSDFRGYTCDLCGLTFKLTGALKEHVIRKHSPNKTNCKVCCRVFPNEEKFRVHKCGVGQLVCPVCGVSVIGKKRLTSHMKSHDPIGRYKCTRCPAVYKCRSALVVHENKHDGLKMNKCEFCDRAFYSPSALYKHRRVHTGEKPYKCKICNKGFTANHNLKVHMSVHGIRNLIVKKNQEPLNTKSIFTLT